MNQLMFENHIQDKSQDEIICHCHKVSSATIKMAIYSGNASSVEEIQELTEAGNACRACICRIERIIAGFPVKCSNCSDCPAIKTSEDICEYA